MTPPETRSSDTIARNTRPDATLNQHTPPFGIDAT